MYQNDWILFQLAQERQRDLLRNLRHAELVRQAQSLPHERGHVLYHVLDRVGERLIQWGQRLQARHAAFHTSLSPSHEVRHG